MGEAAGSFVAVLWVSTALDAVTALLVLAAPWPRVHSPGRRDGTALPAVTAGRLLGAVFTAGVVFVIKVPLLERAFAVDAFGAIHLLFLDVAVGLPLVAGALLAGHILTRQRRALCSRSALAIAALAILPAGAGAYARFVEPKRLQVEIVTVPLDAARAGRSPVRVGVLADLQTDRVTEYEEGAVAELMALAPDLILIPGDLFQGSIAALEAELPALQALLARLRAPAGVFLVQGNVDWTSHLERLVENTGIQLLRDETRTLVVHDRQITLGGLGLAMHPGTRGRALIQELEAAPGTGDVRLLMGHFPDWVFDMTPASRVDLLIAGHTHGGQVTVPFLGPPITLSSVPRSVAAGGLHSLDGRRIYVSRGVGLERGQAPRIRFLCPPCISLLVLE